MLALLKRKQVTPPPERELINTCAKCSMAKFVDAVVNGNTDGLDWDAIFNEYLTLSGDTHISQTLELVKSITMIENKIIIIQTCIDEMKTGNTDGMAEKLHALGFRFEYKENLQQELELTVTQARGLLIQLKQDKGELDELRKNEGGKATLQDYDMQYSAISEFFGFYIDPTQYTVSRYCADMKRIKERNRQGNGING